MRRKEFMPKEKTVGELFLNSDSWYETRTFQRPYRWTDKETVQLWDDLWGAFERNEIIFWAVFLSCRPPNRATFILMSWTGSNA